MGNKFIIGIVAGTVALIAIIIFISNSTNSQGKELISFAQCIKKSGTIFYGAFWCPHCQATKRMFGAAAKELPYHECSTPDAKGQLQDCTDVGVKSYPTWVFPDGSRLEGEHTLEELSQASGCPLPPAKS